MSEAGPITVVQGWSLITAGGFSSLSAEIIYGTSKICGFLFNLYPSTCFISLYGSKKMLSE